METKQLKALVVKDIVDEANAIQKLCRDYKNNKGTEINFEDLHKLVQKHHHNFISTYPVVVRTLVYEKNYKSKALEKYIIHLKNHPWNKREEYLERQVDWYVFLERENNPRIGSKPLAEFRDNVRRHIMKEDKDFMKAANATKEEVDAERDAIILDRKQRLTEIVKKILDLDSNKNATPSTVPSSTSN